MMKCPYCGEILDFVCDEDRKPDINHYFCPNSQCELFLENVPKNIIDDLITGKKAQDALKKARELYKSLAISYCEISDNYYSSIISLDSLESEAQEYLKEYDEEIASITTQEKE